MASKINGKAFYHSNFFSTLTKETEMVKYIQ